MYLGFQFANCQTEKCSQETEEPISQIIMKLGILTFHCAHNYGAVLQCFGLQEYLKSLGHEVYVIDYRPKYIVNGYKKHARQDWICCSLKSTLIKLTHEPLVWKIREKRYNNFKEFIETKLNLYPYKKGMDYSEFDAIFLGSDQIWEAPITGGRFDDVFFGVGAKCKVISYAASNKSKHLSKSEISYYKEHLAPFSGIGVREGTLQKLLSSITDKKIELNVDPTLLAGHLLINGVEDKQMINGKYVLVYEIVEHPRVIQNAREYAKLIGARVVLLSAYIQYTETDIRDQVASPTDFLNYIRHAECVFTTSFHGTALSIMFQTPFYCYKQHNQSDMRIESLLNIAGLTTRFLEINTIPDTNKIDFIQSKVLLDEAIVESQRFVNVSLND